VVLVAIGGFVAARFFGPKRSDADEDAQGDHAITRALFSAANQGRLDDAESWVAAECRSYVNGYEMSMGETEQGPALLVAVMTYYDQAFEDWFWELYDEVSQEHDRHHESVAIRFVAGGGFDDRHHEIEMAGFLSVTDGKLSELRLVADMTTFNRMRLAVGLPLVE
jgi:hypothetical protein